MFQNNEIISISHDVRIGVYYANVVKIDNGQITLVQEEMNPDVIVTSADLKSTAMRFYDDQNNR